MRLFYSKYSKLKFIGYANARYLYDPHKVQSQTVYVFTYRGSMISCCSTKQTLTTTSSNRVENINTS